MNGGSPITVGRDVNGVLLNGDNNVLLQITFNGDNGSRVSDYPGPRPVPVRRGTISLLPRSTGQVIGRDRELAELDSAVSAGGTVQLIGSAGIGKSALLRYAARHLGSGPDGVVFLSARDRDVSEIAQEIFRACYESSGYMPSAVELQQQLQHLQLRVYLDDLTCSTSDLKQLMDVLQSSALVFAARQRIPATAAVRTIPIGGLDESAAVNLLARHLPRSLTADERSVALTLLAALDSSPRHLQRVAAIGQRTLPEQKQLPRLLPTLLRQQPPEARDVLHLIVSVGGGDISPFHLDGLLRRHDSDAVCRALARAGLLTESEAGYLVPEDVKAEVHRMRPTAYPADVLCRHFTAWAEDPATDPDAVADHHQALDTVVVRAEQEGHPDLGVRLARAAAPKLQASLRFTAWGTLLGAGWAAAEKAGDKQAKAYFMHEEGIRCLLTHKLMPAALLLTEAAVLWQELSVLGQMHIARESARLASSQSITSSGMHTGIGAGGAHVSGHAALGGSAQAHMAHAAGQIHAHVAGAALQAAHAGGAAAASSAAPLGTTMPTAAVHGAAAVGHGGTAGLAQAPSVFTPPGHLTIATGNPAPVLPTSHAPLAATPVHSAPIAKPVWHAPGAQTPATSAGHGSVGGAAHGSAAHGSAVHGSATHGSATHSHAAVGSHGAAASHTGAVHGSSLSTHGTHVAHHMTKTVFHPGAASGVHGATAAASHGAASGAASGAMSTTTAAAGTSSTAATGTATAGVGAVKAAAVGLTLCAAVAGGVAVVRANQSPSVPPPVYPSTSSVDAICAGAISSINADEASVNTAYDDLESATSTYNSSVNSGGQGDWGPVTSSGNALINQLGGMGQAVDSARSQASDPTLISALGDASTAIGTWSQNIRAFVNQSANSYDNSASSFNDAVSRINQVCH